MSKTWSDFRAKIGVWEDSTTLVVNKPPGLSVMGERHETDLVAMAEAAGEPLYWVNRIDKVTSGLVLLAKSREAHGLLTRQFAKRTVGKWYLAICYPGGMPGHGRVNLPLFTASSGRIRVAAERNCIQYDRASSTWFVDPVDLLPRKNYPSRTEYAALWGDDQNVLIVASPLTGRRHQLRVHLAWIGHAIVGDPLFTKRSGELSSRTCLHSWRVAFNSANDSGARVELQVDPDPDFWLPTHDRLNAEDLDVLLSDFEKIPQS